MAGAKSRLYRWAEDLVGVVGSVTTRREWRGIDTIPRDEGVLLVVNHTSHSDPIVLGHALTANGYVPRFLAKHTLFEAPVIGRILTSGEQIPVRRESRDAQHAFTAAVDAIGRGELVVIYPEGTVTRDPDLWPMRGKTGAARIALATGCKVLPVAQWGAEEVWPQGTRVPRLHRRHDVSVLVGAPVALDDLRAQGIRPDTLREATDRIMADITALVADLRGQPAPSVRFDPRSAGSTPQPRS